MRVHMHSAKQFFKHLRFHSSSFYLASLWLPASKRIDAAKLYYFCRYLDDIADIPNLEQVHIINQMRHDIQSGQPSHPVSTHMLTLMTQYQIDSAIPLALINGIQKDLKPVAISSEKMLLVYAYEVAGTVGLMMSYLLDTTDKTALYHAIDLGIAMQLTNIARDIYEDALLNRIYLPKDWVYGMTAQDILNPSATHTVIINRALNQLLQLANDYYKSGYAGIKYLPKKYRKAIFRAAQLYQSIGHELQQKDTLFQKKKTTTGLGKKLYLTVKISKAGMISSHHDQALHNALINLPLTNHETTKSL